MKLTNEFKLLQESSSRISNILYNTPILYSQNLNELFGHEYFFKIDALQLTGSFKIRGVINHLLWYKEKHGNFPEKIVAYSTGNHALAIGFAAKMFNIKSRVYLPANVVNIKKYIAKYYGCEVIEVQTRQEAQDKSIEDGENGYYYLHPSDNLITTLGAGTMCLEALNNIKKDFNINIDAIFAPCGGGGLLAGSYIAKEMTNSNIKIFGVEPENANDAYISFKQNSIYYFKDSPNTIADGLRALNISNIPFKYIQNIDDFYLCQENDIIKWTAILMHFLKITCEPSAALAMEGAFKWSKSQKQKTKNLILISGGNITNDLYKLIASYNIADATKYL